MALKLTLYGRTNFEKADQSFDFKEAVTLPTFPSILALTVTLYVIESKVLQESFLGYF